MKTQSKETRYKDASSLGLAGKLPVRQYQTPLLEERKTSEMD